MSDFEERISKLEKEIKDLKKEYKDGQPKKEWPDTIEKALDITTWWGFCIIDDDCKGTSYYEDKYIVFTGAGDDSHLFIQPNFRWCDKEEVDNYWKNDGEFEGNTYYFKSFDTAEDLYLWMAEK